MNLYVWNLPNIYEAYWLTLDKQNKKRTHSNMVLSRRKQSLFHLSSKNVLWRTFRKTRDNPMFLVSSQKEEEIED